MSKKNADDSLVVDRVREQIQKIVEEELEQLFQQMKIAEGSTERVKRRIEDLLKNYRDVESLLGNLSKMSLLGLMGDTAKVIEYDARSAYGSIRENDTAEVKVDAGSTNCFDNHPSGRYFILDRKKKYRLLVAFIPVEAET